MNYEQELSVILDEIPKENLSFFTKDIQILSKREFGKLWSDLSVEDAWLLATNYREEIPEVWGVLPEDAITLEEVAGDDNILKQEEEVSKGICFECGTEVNDDMFRCSVCDTPLEWEDIPHLPQADVTSPSGEAEFAEAVDSTVIKSLEKLGENTKIHKVKVEGKGTIGDREKEVSTLVDTP